MRWPKEFTEGNSFQHGWWINSNLANRKNISYHPSIDNKCRHCAAAPPPKCFSIPNTITGKTNSTPIGFLNVKRILKEAEHLETFSGQFKFHLGFNFTLGHRKYPAPPLPWQQQGHTQQSHKVTGGSRVHVRRLLSKFIVCPQYVLFYRTPAFWVTLNFLQKEQKKKKYTPARAEMCFEWETTAHSWKQQCHHCSQLTATCSFLSREEDVKCQPEKKNSRWPHMH